MAVAYEDIASDLLSQATFDGILSQISDVFYAANASDFVGPVDPVAAATARNLANTAARSLLEQITTSELRSMGETIARGLEEGKRPLDMASKLREVRSLDVNRQAQLDKLDRFLQKNGVPDDRRRALLARERERLVRDRRRTTAQNEGRVATSTANEQRARRNDMKYKRWVNAGDERVCSVCGANTKAGLIPIDKAFPSGHMTTPGHPGKCRCTIAYTAAVDGPLYELETQRAARAKQMVEEMENATG